MIADSFDSRTLANMEVVLERHVKSSRRGPRNMNFVGIAPATSRLVPSCQICAIGSLVPNSLRTARKNREAPGLRVMWSHRSASIIECMR